MRKIKCDNINVKILLNENDFLKKEIKRLNCEIWQIHAETNALHTVTMPILKNRIAWCDEENKRKIDNLEKKLQKAREETAREILTKLQPYIGGWVLFKELEKQYGVEEKE